MSRSVEIYCVAPAFVPTIWPKVRAWFATVFDDYPADTTIEVTEADVLSGMQLLWIAVEGLSIVAAATTALCKTPARKFCQVTACYGVNTKLWGKFMPKVEAYAKAEGCQSVRLSGRRGWMRVLSDYQQPWIVLEKDLSQ